MPALKKSSLSDQVYDKLRANIVNLTCPLGSRLNVNELQEAFGVSSTPIREAINRLQAERLVTYESNVGARVLALDDDDVREIQDLAVTLHAAAVNFAMRRGDRRSMAAEIRRHLNGYLKAQTVEGTVKGIYNLIGTFYRHCGNSRLDNNMKVIQGEQLILRHLYAGYLGAAHKDAEDYERIHASVVKGDADAIIETLRENYEHSTPIIIEALHRFYGQSAGK